MSEITDIIFHTQKKTGVKSRVFPIKASTPFLKEWKSKNKDRGKNDFVFFSAQGHKKGQMAQERPITTAGLNYHIKELAKKCGIEKNVFPYLFRFSKLTQLYENPKMDDRNTALLAGHGLGMAGTYHKTNNTIAREMLIREVLEIREMSKAAKTKIEKQMEDIKAENEKLRAEVKTDIANIQKFIIEQLEKRGFRVRGPE